MSPTPLSHDPSAAKNIGANNTGWTYQIPTCLIPNFSYRYQTKRYIYKTVRFKMVHYTMVSSKQVHYRTVKRYKTVRGSKWYIINSTVTKWYMLLNSTLLHKGTLLKNGTLQNNTLSNRYGIIMDCLDLKPTHPLPQPNPVYGQSQSTALH